MYILILYEKKQCLEKEKWNLIVSIIHPQFPPLLMSPVILKQSAMLLYACVCSSHCPHCQKLYFTFYLQNLCIGLNQYFFLKVRLNVCKGSVPTNKLATAAQYQGAFTVTESRETRKTKVSVKFHHNLQRIVAALDAYTRLKVQDQEYL